jgi:hypothetical protein
MQTSKSVKAAEMTIRNHTVAADLKHKTNATDKE